MNHPRPFVFLGLVLLHIGIVSSGCRSGVNSVERAVPTAPAQLLADKRITTDSSLSKRVQVLAVREDDDGPGGFLRLQFEIRNGTGSLQPFTYRVEWFDAAGMSIHLPTASAIPFTLQPRETSSITVTAPTPTAKDFRFKIQRPSN